ncbi:unnamed protein product [Adineta steineri]|uniref:Uncharacterized protein n=1 Tax=Adineta steineri TaxID=433720 RepID=A0A815V9Y4_9BILA|nr:unnamed protein product [Adineta steineri]CAF1527338.1 unnamed protein product [Adineta steineri]CAF1527658.1 unnamed protein product [Adineta steineri]
MKYLKHARFYERIVIIVVISHDEEETFITTENVSRLYQYRQIQMMITISFTNIKDDHINIILSINTQDNASKEIQKFQDYQSLIVQLQQLMDEAEDFDDGLFAVFNQREKALRDVRQELGAFVWGQSYRGQFIYPPKSSQNT